jgi:hypothetical protein
MDVVEDMTPGRYVQLRADRLGKENAKTRTSWVLLTSPSKS